MELDGSLRVEFQKLTKERLQTHRRSRLRLEAGGVSEQPSPLHVALWLRECGVAAPTAASNAFSSLRWLEDHLRFCFHTRSPTVTVWGRVARGHKEKQKEPMSPAQWARLEGYALGAAGPRRVLLAAWLVVLGGVVRFAHLQRNQLSLLPGVLASKASLGKVKVRGARSDLQPLFEDLVLLQGHQSVAGLPDLTGKNLDCLVTAPGSMSLSRFHFLSRLLFQEMGRTKEASSAVTTYSARRVLPSVGDALCLSASDRVWPWEAGLARLLTRQWVPVRGGSECRCGTLAFSESRASSSGSTLFAWCGAPWTQARLCLLGQYYPELLGVRVHASSSTSSGSAARLACASLPSSVVDSFTFSEKVAWFDGLQPSAMLHLRRLRYATCRVKPGSLLSVAGVGCASARLSGRAACQRCLAAYRDM